MDHSHARENLVAAVEALSGIGLTPFLVDGTLLGAVREGNFIGHDKDIDLGLPIEQLTPAIVVVLQACGFTPWKTYGLPERGLQYSFKRHGIKLDIFFYYPDNGELFHAAWKDGTPIRYGYPTFILGPLEFLGHTFHAPADPVAFLVTKYGPEWKTPVTVWDWAWGPHNAVPWREVP